MQFSVCAILSFLFNHGTQCCDDSIESMLSAAGIGSPCPSLTARGSNTIPYYRIRFLIQNCLGMQTGRTLFDERTSTEEIYLRDIFGCTHSKSVCGDFNFMNQCFITDAEMAERVSKSLFSGRDDCIAQQGEVAEVIRQNWDKKQWFMNNGGSHRAAALQAFDIKNGIDRTVLCNVTTVSPSRTLQHIAKQSDIFLIKVSDEEGFHHLYCALQERHPTIKIRSFQPSGYGQHNGHYSIQMDRGSWPELHDALLNKGALNVAMWVRNPQAYTFDHASYLIPHKFEQLPHNGID